MIRKEDISVTNDVLNTHSAMRVTSVERPRSLFARLLYRVSSIAFGKVLTPVSVIYARKPKLAVIAGLITRMQDKGLTIEPSLRFLIQAQVSRLNGCAFCHDLALAQAMRQHIGVDRFHNLAAYRDNLAFSNRERAALSLVDEATIHRRVSDETWATVHTYFDDTEIIELVWLNAAENYFNLQATVLGIGSDDLSERLLRHAAVTQL